MPRQWWMIVSAGALACGPSSAAPLTSAHGAAIRDSVATFLEAHAAFMSEYPVGQAARVAALRMYAPDVVVGADVAPVDPVVMEGVEPLLAGERPPWLRRFAFIPERTLIKPLAPGVAVVTELYREEWTDTTGTVTTIRGMAMLALRNTEDGWRIVQFQSAHPAVTDSVHSALMRRFGDQ